MITLSKNCDEYTDHVSSQVNVMATHKDSGTCQINTTIMSCQESQFETPDELTMKTIKDKVYTMAENEPSCTGLNFDDFEFLTKSVILGSKSTELSGKDLFQKRMASNCADGFDIKKINSHNHYTCRNFGTMKQVSTGKDVKNYNMTFTGILPSCENSFELSAQTEEDIKKLVMYRAKEEGLLMKFEDIACDTFGAPIL